jgi:hypothetical protein
MATNASMNLDRGISSQAIYLIHAPVEIVAQTLLSADPVVHPEIGTLQHRRFRDAKDAHFDTLRLDAKRSSIGTMVRSAHDPRRFQMSRDEIPAIPKERNPEAVRQFLVTILQQRWHRFSQEGKLGGAGTFDARSEIQSLLKEEPKIAAHFVGLLAPLTAPAGAGSPALSYWDLSEVDKVGAIALGALYSTDAGDRRQVLDLTYYSSSGYLVAVALYELAAVTVNEKPATLVWHGALVSSTELTGGFGIKRRIASVVIGSDLEKVIRAFRKDAEAAAQKAKQ